MPELEEAKGQIWKRLGRSEVKSQWNKGGSVEEGRTALYRRAPGARLSFSVSLRKDALRLHHVLLPHRECEWSTYVHKIKVEEIFSLVVKLFACVTLN